MKTDPIMEELWKIKEQIAAENGYDLGRIVDSCKKWETKKTIRPRAKQAKMAKPRKIA